MKRLAVGSVVSLVLVTSTAASGGPPIRSARASDVAARSELSPGAYFDWWQLHAIDPRSNRYLRIDVTSTGGPLVRGLVFDGRKAYGGTFHTREIWSAGTLRREGASWRVTLNGAADLEGEFTLRGRRGVKVGPWRLGKQKSHDPPWSSEDGSLFWSGLPLAGRLDGRLHFQTYRTRIRSWYGYLDHTWGRLALESRSYMHWDFAVRHPAPGESWVLQGLEVRSGTEKDLDWRKPRDRAWQGVLVHATPSGITACRPRVIRRGWFGAYFGGLGGPFPSKVSATCGGRTVTFRKSRLWTDRGSSSDDHTLGWGPTPDHNGFVQHIVAAE